MTMQTPKTLVAGIAKDKDRHLDDAGVAAHLNATYPVGGSAIGGRGK